MKTSRNLLKEEGRKFTMDILEGFDDEG